MQGIKMYRYELIVYWSNEDNLFLVEVPELPGCMADGKNYEQAVSNAQLVIEEWIDTAGVHASYYAINCL